MWWPRLDQRRVSESFSGDKRLHNPTNVLFIGEGREAERAHAGTTTTGWFRPLFSLFGVPLRGIHVLMAEIVHQPLLRSEFEVGRAVDYHHLPRWAGLAMRHCIVEGTHCKLSADNSVKFQYIGFSRLHFPYTSPHFLSFS